MNARIAVLIPCLNEEKTIDKVVKDFRCELPEAEIHVFDNASTDATPRIAEEAGAIVHRENRRGKGCVVQTMFQTVDADIYIMVDGDDTYPAEAVHSLLADVAAGEADMMVGSRFLCPDSSFRPLNYAGNQLFLRVINALFGTRLTDVLSGYRVMNRRFVKELPLFVPGFEIEVEMTIKALARGYRLQEKPARLRDRPEGSCSKLRKFRDGCRILWTIFALMRDYKPMTTFGALGGTLIFLGLWMAMLLGTGSVAAVASGRLLTILSLTLLLSGMLAMAVGTILHILNRRIREIDHLVHAARKSLDPAPTALPSALKTDALGGHDHGSKARSTILSEPQAA
jgi:glycosyltransferase involved in cell wall biosynthesis